MPSTIESDLMKSDSPGNVTVIRGGLILPMTRSEEYFAGDVVLRNGRIAEIRRGSAAIDHADLTVEAEGAAVLPGFIQGHVHVVQSLLRHQADGLELLDWLRHRTLPYEAALDGDAVEAAAALGIAELLSGGTTTVLDFGTTHDHDRVFRAARRLGIRMISGKTHMDIGDEAPARLLEHPEESIARAERLGSKWHGAEGGRLRYCVSPRFALSCSRRLLEWCADLARTNGWLLQTHASENRDEVASVRRLTGLSNIEYLADVGLTGPDVILAHGVHLESSDIQLLAQSGTTICHCPGTNLKLGSGIADVPRLLSAGVPVILGADGAPCNNRLSIFHEMALAGTIHAVRHGPGKIGAWHVLTMATRSAAKALHLSDEVGTLEAGKAADLVVIDLKDWSALPGGDPASRIVYGGSAASVRHVFVDGEHLVSNGVIQSDDPDALRREVSAAWHRTRQRMEAAT